MRSEIATCLLALLLGAPSGTAQQSAGDRSRVAPEQMRADLIYLRDVWAPLDKSLGAEARRAFQRTIAETMSRCDTLTNADFNLEVARAVAVARNGHTLAWLGPFFHGLPFEAAWFADGLYIVGVDPQHPELLGARIAQFGPLTAEQALARVAPFISGIDGRIRYLSPLFLRLLEVLHHIGATADRSRIVLTLVLPDGTSRTDTLVSNSPDGQMGGFWPALLPQRLDAPGRWLHVLDRVSEQSPFYRSPVAAASEWLGGGHRVLYVRSNRIDTTTASQLARVVSDDIVSNRPTYVVVDLRNNPGGDYFNTVLFAQELPRLIPRDGRIFVLVGPATFSAAIVTAAMLKGHGGDRVVLVGESMGDNARFWSEGADMPLPNSKILVRPAPEFQDWGNGCDDLAQCFWPNVVFGAKSVSLVPTIQIAPSFAQYAAGRDPILERVLQETTLTRPVTRR